MELNLFAKRKANHTLELLTLLRSCYHQVIFSHKLVQKINKKKTHLHKGRKQPSFRATPTKLDSEALPNHLTIISSPELSL